MAPHPRQHAGLGGGGATRRVNFGRAAGRTRLPDPSPRALHLGPGSGRREATGRDSGVLVRRDGSKARHATATPRIPPEKSTPTPQAEGAGDLWDPGVLTAAHARLALYPP